MLRKASGSAAAETRGRRVRPLLRQAEEVDVKRQGSLESAARFLAAGFELAALVLGTLLMGSYLDRWLGSEPIFTVLLVLGGLVAGTRRLLWLAKKNSGR